MSASEAGLVTSVVVVAYFVDAEPQLSGECSSLAVAADMVMKKEFQVYFSIFFAPKSNIRESQEAKNTYVLSTKLELDCLALLMFGVIRRFTTFEWGLYRRGIETDTLCLQHG